MPLVAHFGSASSRTDEALWEREEKSKPRGYGPTPGSKRSAHMQKEGKGPPPGHEAFLEREKRRQQRRRQGEQRAPAAAGAAAAGAAWGADGGEDTHWGESAQ